MRVFYETCWKPRIRNKIEHTANRNTRDSIPLTNVTLASSQVTETERN